MSGTTDTIGATDATQRPSFLSLLGWLVFVALVLYALLIGGGWAGIYWWRFGR